MKTQISNLYPRDQVIAEIAWLNEEIERVKKIMVFRPSKYRHLQDLERQKRDRENILDKNDKH